MKAAVTRSKTEQASNSCTVKISGITQGELKSALNALGVWASCSPVARDVYYALYAAATAPGGFPEAAEGVVNPDDREYVVSRRDAAPPPPPPTPVKVPKARRCRNCGGLDGHAISFSCKDSDFEDVD